MKPYKVLQVVNISFVLPYYFGDQYDYFQKKGIEFHVACSPSEHLNRYAELKKFKAFPVDILRKISPLRDLITLILLIRYIKKNKIDFVIGYTPKGALLGLLAAYLSGIENRVYYRLGIMYETSKGLKRWILKNIEIFTGMLATKVVCISPSLLQLSNQIKLSHPSKNIILGKGSCNGIDIVKYDRKNDQELSEKLFKKLDLKDNYVLGYVGRLVNDKGIIELINAWKIVKKSNQNAKLLLVGPFEDNDKLPSETIEIINSEPSILHIGLVYYTYV